MRLKTVKNTQNMAKTPTTDLESGPSWYDSLVRLTKWTPQLHHMDACNATAKLSNTYLGKSVTRGGSVQNSQNIAIEEKNAQYGTRIQAGVI